MGFLIERLVSVLAEAMSLVSIHNLCESFSKMAKYSLLTSGFACVMDSSCGVDPPGLCVPLLADDPLQY